MGISFVRGLYRERVGEYEYEAYLWSLALGERVSAAVVDAAVAYELETGKQAEYAFVSQIPKGASEGVSITGVMLVLAAWVPRGAVAISGQNLRVS